MQPPIQEPDSQPLQQAAPRRDNRRCRPLHRHCTVDRQINLVDRANFAERFATRCRPGFDHADQAIAQARLGAAELISGESDWRIRIHDSPQSLLLLIAIAAVRSSAIDFSYSPMVLNSSPICSCLVSGSIGSVNKDSMTAQILAEPSLWSAFMTAGGRLSSAPSLTTRKPMNFMPRRKANSATAKLSSSLTSKPAVAYRLARCAIVLAVLKS